jgi:hypothetical protein
MGRAGVAAGLAATALAGCGGGDVVLRAGSVADFAQLVPPTATATPTALPGGPHATMLVCPLRAGRGLPAVRPLGGR